MHCLEDKMAKLYFAKANINSHINNFTTEDVRKTLDILFKEIDDKKEYIKIIENKFEDEEGNEVQFEKVEVYNFSEIERNYDEKYITGWLVKRTPTYTEEFDKVARVSKKVVYEDTAVSTLFYFDLQTEIITFCTKNRMGYNQIMEYFEYLLNLFTPDITYKLMLLNDPFNLDDTIENMKKVHKVTTVLIPPNAANRSALQKLFEDKEEEFQESNTTKEIITLESDERNGKGLNKESSTFKRVISLAKAFMERGYGKADLEGENSKGELISYNSDKDSAYQVDIEDNLKESRIVLAEKSKNGIKRFFVKKTLDDK